MRDHPQSRGAASRTSPLTKRPLELTQGGRGNGCAVQQSMVFASEGSEVCSSFRNLVVQPSLCETR